MAKKIMSIEDMQKALEKKQAKLALYCELANKIKNEIRWLGHDEVETDAWREEYTDPETGETKTRWHSAVYKTDPVTGETLHRDPTPDEWGYEKFILWQEILEEVTELAMQ